MIAVMSWSEKVNRFSIDPAVATLEDIARMATELSESMAESYNNGMAKRSEGAT